MPAELIQLNARHPATRVFMILLLIAATFWSYFVVRWYLGNTLAEYLTVDENSLQMARVAESLAPSDPLPHWRLGDVSVKKLPADQQDQAIREYEKAVSLSPNDYRFWTSLGTALEQAGDDTRAEQSLRQAVALAPAYAYPHWYLGNLLLRSLRYDEAFAELRLASEANTALRPQLFNIVWEIYGDDFKSLTNAAGSSPEVRAEFSLFLLGQKRYDEGLRLWNSLSEAEKRMNQSSGESVLTALVNVQKYHDAMSVWNDLAPSAIYRSAIGSVLDGGFEEEVAHKNGAVFGWQVSPAPQMQIGIDPEKAHTGSRSLRLLFQVRSRIDEINASQLVPVSSSTQYDLEYYVKTEKLQSGGTPLIQILDATDHSTLASSEPVANGDNDWQPVTLSFKTGAKSEAVIIKIVRASCGDTPVCPIFGAVWYDDFRFKRRD